MALAGALLAGLASACSAPQHVVVISVDTLRADRLGAYGSELGLTPHIDALAGRCVVFEYAFAPSSYTLPSVSALLTGRHPEEIGMWTNRSALAREVPTLTELLRERGYRSGAVVSNFVLRRRGAGLERGFEEYDDTFPGVDGTRGLPERTAPATTDAALRVFDALRGGPAPVFLWVHYQDPHGPYLPPEGERERRLEAERSAPDGRRELAVGEGHDGVGAIPRYQAVGENREVAFYRAGYDGEVSFADAEIGRLLAGLAERGALEHTLLVLTADHGESLGEDDYWFAHGEYLSEPLVRVPLLICDPSRGAQRRRDPASLLDVLPTIAARVGARVPAVEGRNLLATGAAEEQPPLLLANRVHSRVPRFGLIADGYHFVTSRDGEQLHPLGEPGQDRMAAEPERAGHLRSLLEALRTLTGSGAKESRQALSADDRKRLEALGYVER